MNIKKVYTRRNFEKSSFWHLVYEWEDMFAKHLEVPFSKATYRDKLADKISNYLVFFAQKTRLYKFYIKFTHLAVSIFTTLFLDRLIFKVLRLKCSEDKTLVFEMYPSRYFSIKSPYKIPYIIDFDYGVDLKHFYLVYRNCDLIIISGLEAYNYLKQQNCPLPIEHVPLSLSDKYQINTSFPIKIYDIVIAGRRNKLLWDFMLKFECKFPEIEYVYSSVENGKFYYKSNKKGIIGEFPDRDSYLDLLSQSKIGFYSTPGIDEEKTLFINHVTSRVFEYIYSGCLLVGRYPLNNEVKAFKLDDVCNSVNSYQEFEELIIKYLSTDLEEVQSTYVNYLSDNYTSKRVGDLKKIIKNY